MINNSINSNLKILVCEENIRVLKRLEVWLKTITDEVLITEDGIVANSFFNEFKPDILLVSLDLKNMNGLELIEKIKRKNPSQAVILMLNNNTEPLSFKRAIDLMVDKYLNKPVEATSLFSTIEALANEKLWHKDYQAQKKLLNDYKDAIDLSFSVSKHDKNGNIFYVNESFCEATSLTYEEAMAGLINPLNNPEANMDAVWDTLHSKQIYRDRQIFKFEDKQDHIIDITAVSILEDDGEISEVLVFSKDVSEVVYAARKIKQQEVEKKLQKLEHIKEVNKIKDSFLTVFTHELKTPLNSIINFSEYVQKHLLKEEFRKRDILVEQVAQIKASGLNMLDMITNLIDAMKVKDGLIELNQSEFLLNKSLDTVLEKYSIDLENIKIVKSYQNECNIFSDEARVSQIFSNLISNAIKYCKSTIAIVVKSNEDEFVVEVLDDGDGIKNKTEVLNLFEQSSEDDMTRTAKGTGVGLYLVKRLCDRLNYQIDIFDSKELGGTRVRIKGKRGI